MVIPSAEDEEAQADLLDTPMETTVMVNAQNILKVADAIEQHTIADLGFNMVMWRQFARDDAPDMSGHNCGTTACVAGWACAVLLNDLEAVDALGMTEMGRDFFGLDHDQSFELFIAQGRAESDMADVPQDQAIRTLRHLAATGEVDWTV